MATGYYRVRSTAERTDHTAAWGALVELFEVDEAGVPVRQLNVYESTRFRERFDRERPFIENALGERFGHRRAEPLDLAAVELSRITRDEFELAWESGQLSVREFSEFKWEMLAETSEDVQGVHEILWEANNWYPDLPASERLAMAERTVRELLEEGLVTLVKDGFGPAPTMIAGDEQDEILRSWNTWSVAEGRQAFVSITDAGEQALVRTGSTRRLP